MRVRRDLGSIDAQNEKTHRLSLSLPSQTCESGEAAVGRRQLVSIRIELNEPIDHHDEKAGAESTAWKGYCWPALRHERVARSGVRFAPQDQPAVDVLPDRRLGTKRAKIATAAFLRMLGIYVSRVAAVQDDDRKRTMIHVMSCKCPVRNAEHARRSSLTERQR